MYTVRVKNLKLKEALLNIQSDSKLEEMLVLMMQDRNIQQMIVRDNKLFRVIRAEGTAPVAEEVPNWLLALEELNQFLRLFKKEVQEKSNKQLMTKDFSILFFEDGQLSFSSPPYSEDIVLNINKAR